MTDAFLLRLQRTAAYRTEDGVTSLHLDGQAGYAEIPAINIRRSNFSISVRFNLQDIQSLQHILSDWSAPFQFRLYVSNSWVHVTLRRGGNVQDLLLMSSSGFVYYLVHVASHLFYQFAPFFLFFNLHAYYSAKLFLLFFWGGGGWLCSISIYFKEKRNPGCYSELPQIRKASSRGCLNTVNWNEIVLSHSSGSIFLSVPQL